jgi:antirestriction protein ArdC
MDSFTSQTLRNVLTALDAGIIPWRRPWRADLNCGPHTNVVTGRRFSGVNQILLEMAARKLGLASQWWAMSDRWRRMGGAINPVPAGWGTEIVLYQADGSYTTTRMLNLDHVEGEFPDLRPGQPLTPDVDAAEALIRKTGARFEYQFGRKAIYYRLDEATGKGDYIEFPLKEQFASGVGGLEGYYDTAFHELLHWSESRLGWVGDEASGELRAEMGAGFLVTEMGLPTLESRQALYPHMDLMVNHHQWLPEWTRLLTQDPPLLLRVAENAAEATDFLLRFVRRDRQAAMPRQSLPQPYPGGGCFTGSGFRKG